MAASGESPSPDKAFFTTPAKSERVRMTVGMPLASILAAARPQAVAQDPQAALPMITASTPLSFTICAVFRWRWGRCPVKGIDGQYLAGWKILFQQALHQRQCAVGLPLIVAEQGNSLACQGFEPWRVRLAHLDIAGRSKNSKVIIFCRSHGELWLETCFHVSWRPTRGQ